MSANAAPATQAPSDLAWRVIGLVNLYRLLVPFVLLGIQWLGGDDVTGSSVRPMLFTATCAAYLVAGVLLVIARRLAWPNLGRAALANAFIDVIALSVILYASGGVGSGLGILLVLPVGALALLANNRNAFVIAALAALGVLIQQILNHLAGMASSPEYMTAGVLGAVLFGIALGTWPIANRLRESEALVRRQEVDLANLAQLSQYIVQHLRESILVVDANDCIRLINESAAQILGDGRSYPGALLGEASPKLLYLLETWRTHKHSFPDPTQTFVSADGTRVVQPHFAPLGSAKLTPVLIFLEDTGDIAERVQQSKLAALGRLSASIAHEIRNPVGAMSHAGQLLAESPQLSAEDKRLTEIISSNAERVSAIINNILQLSRREEAKTERLSLHAWVEEFQDEFCETMQWPPERLRIIGPKTDVEVRSDATQLRQVVWNLCDNAIRHAVRSHEDQAVEIRFGRLVPSARPFLEIADRGPGVPADHAGRIFEPFYSGERGGTGLGLFLARELAQTNGATLLYEPRPGGGSIFRMVFADPQRWELR